MEPTLVANAMIGSVASGFFLWMAFRVQAQEVSPEARPAMQLFAVWWMALAVYAVAGATADLASAMGATLFGLLVAVEYMQAFALCIGLWGLMYYLAYILTGSKRLMLPLAVFYSLYYATILFFVTTGRPIAVDVDAWHARLLYETPFIDRFATALLLVIPPVVGAGTYFAIYAQTPSRAARYRIVALSIATLAWSVSLVARESNIYAALPAFVALFAAFSARWAYEPPRWVRAKLREPPELALARDAPQ
jgi:hypothetical protein